MNKFLHTTLLTKFNPKPYDIFELENNELNILNSKTFESQLDHCLAVIWCLFSKRTPVDSLTIPQIKPTLWFLKKVQINGKYTPDIKFCIELLEDLIEKKRSEKMKFVDEQIQTIEKTNSCGKMKSMYSLSNKIPFKIPAFLSLNEDDREEVLKYIRKKNVLYENYVNEDKLNFLLWWRREQMVKIKHELQKLHTIEWLIEKVDSSFSQDSKVSVNVEV